MRPQECFLQPLNVSVYQRGETALHMAARAGQMEVVRCLLRNGALVDAIARVSQSYSPVPSAHHRAAIFHPPTGERVLTGLAMLSFLTQPPRAISLPSRPSTPGGPDSPPHFVPFGENRYCPAAAAAHGSPGRFHHQRLHPPPHLSQGGPGRDRRRAAGGRSLTLAGHKGEHATEILKDSRFLQQKQI